MRIQPIKDMVLMRPIVEEKVGRFFIPDSAKPHNSVEAVVVAVGPGRLSRKGVRIPTGISPGDHVYVRWHFESKIELDGEVFMMMQENEVIGVREF